MGFSKKTREEGYMKYKDKAYHEANFIEQILLVGIERVYETDEGNKTYYCFDLKNGNQRFWRDLSKENKEKIYASLKKQVD